MKVKLQINIGYRDQTILELASGSEGDVLDVPEPVAKRLITKGWGVDASDIPEASVEKKPADKKAGGK